MADWSSLPPDLVRRVGDCLVATNDVDSYMDLRAVCHNWRSSTVVPCPPGAGAGDLLRLCPWQWVMLEDSPKADNEAGNLFVNVITGRFLQRRLLLLRDHLLVSASDGLLILADWESPHAASVLNPFTGFMVRFDVPIPPGRGVRAAVTESGSLVVAVDCIVDGHKVCCADPSGKSTKVQFSRPGPIYLAGMVSCRGHVYMADTDGSIFKVVEAALHCYGELVAEMPDAAVSSKKRRAPLERHNRVFLVDSAKELLVVVRRTKKFGRSKVINVFKVDVERGALEPLESIGGNRALFLGDRCLSVDAHKLPSVEGNCVYYKSDIYCYRYDLNDGTEERIEGMHIFQRPDKNNSSVRPFSIVHVLLDHCWLVPGVLDQLHSLHRLYHNKYGWKID